MRRSTSVRSLERRESLTRKLVVSVLVVLLAVAIFGPQNAVAAPYVNSGDIFPDVWDSLDTAWENGNPSGYSESQTAAMVAKITTNSTSEMQVELCLQVVEVQMGNNYYAFSGFNAWNTTHSPSVLPDGSAVSISHTLSVVSAQNATLTGVSAPALGQGFCDADYLGVTVTFEKTVAADPAWLFWGGVVAQAGASLPTGSPDTTVPANRSASFINGTFQSRVEGAGDKTINFKGSQISLTPGINLVKTVTTQTGTCGVDDTSSISVAQGSTIKFCFSVQNTGQTDLIDVTLNDLTLSTDLTSSLVGLTNEDGDGLSDDLAVGATATAELLHVASADIDNTAVAQSGQQQSTDMSMATVYFCGDGNVDPGEQCDDGGTDDGDGCSSLCVNEFCGDGIVQTGLGEQCDDGGTTPEDGCNATCQDEFCGDGVLQVGLGEECDDGGTATEDGCDGSCLREFCGDGITQVGLGEECDDGGIVPGDGCDEVCQDEFCGDGKLQTGLGEQCDDGGTVPGDGCSATCQTEFCGDGVLQTGLGEQCDDGGTAPGDGCNATCQTEFCGDGVLQTGLGEQCDDGGTAPGDGCNAQCQTEFCGDGILQTGIGEQCDDGGTAPGDGCNATCQTEFCGDGVLQTGLGEQCDDGGTAAGDGCDAQCKTEFCGDGVVQPGIGEQCDDGGTVDGDGCSSQCLSELCGDGKVQTGLGEECDDGGTTPGDGCDAQCMNEVCGDGVLQTGLGEQCDDGNTSAGDGCNATCQTEFCGDGILQSGIGETCDDGNTDSNDGCNSQCVTEVCGDGVIQDNLGEVCDDGNTDSGDGCSVTCQTEFCGDGTLQPALGEECDDGNTTDGDGCDASCEIELDVGCVSNVTGGPGVVDQCGVCNGDGTTCCTSFDNFEELSQVDGAAHEQARVVALAAKLYARKVKTRAARRYAKSIKEIAAAGVQQNWNIAWSFPIAGETCDGAAVCVQNDFSALAADYIETAIGLRDLTSTVIKNLRKKIRRKKIGKQLITRAERKYQKNIDILAQVQTVSSTCS